jgi:hypothetical protein
MAPSHTPASVERTTHLRSRDAAEQRDAADEGRLDAYGNVFVGKIIKYQGRVVRPSQLIASVGQTETSGGRRRCGTR